MKQSLLAKLEPVGQQHLLGFWDQLDPAAQRQLAAQINEIDWAEFERLRSHHSGATEDAATARQAWRELAQRSTPPKAVRLGREPASFTRSAARRRGEEALKS